MNLRRDGFIDLDRNATAPLAPEARAAMLAALDLGLGNPSSAHALGQAARGLIEHARAQVAAMLDVEPAEIVFTSGATEANVLAWRGILGGAADPETRAVTTAIEHPSVLGVARQLENEGVGLEVVRVDPCGRLDLAAWERAVAGSGVRLASAMAVNNELGVRLAIAQAARLARAQGAVVHCDATQAVGRVPLDLRGWGVDLASVSAHKLGGPPGVGALWVRRGVRLRAVAAGHQEQGLRAGTENLLGIAGFGAAAAAVPARLAQTDRIRALRDRLWYGLQERIAGVVRNGAVAVDEETGQTLNVSFVGVEGPALLVALDLEDVAVSTGSACSSGSLEPSHVLRALGDGSAAWQARAGGAVRFSLGPENSAAEIERVLDLVPRLVARIRASGAAVGDGAGRRVEPA